MAATPDGTSVYLFGGKTAAGRVASVHRLDVAAKLWAALAPIGPAPTGRSFHRVVVSNDATALLALGGVDESNALVPPALLDLAARTWLPVAEQPSPFRGVGHACALVRPCVGLAWACGGTG